MEAAPRSPDAALAPLLVTREDAARALAVSVATLDRLVKAGRIRVINTSPETTRLARRHGKLVPCRNRGAIRIAVDELRRFIDTAKHPPAKQA